MVVSVNGRFTYDIIDNNTNQSLAESMNVLSIIVNSSINKFPNIQIDLESMKRLDYFDKLSDTTIKVSSTNDFEIEYPFGIAKIVSLSNRNVQLKGYMCKRLDFMELGSEYLGESLSDSISALELRDTVNNVDSIEGDYWRINETKLECLLRLLPGSKPNSIFNIDESSINVIELGNNGSTELKDYIPPSAINSMITCDRFSDTNYSLYESEDEETANKAVPMFNAMWNSLSMVGYEHKDFVSNYMSSLIYNYPLKRVIRLSYNNTYIPYQPGQSMKLDANNYGYDNMLILSKSILYDIGHGKVTTELVLGTIS